MGAVSLIHDMWAASEQETLLCVPTKQDACYRRSSHLHDLLLHYPALDRLQADCRGPWLS